MIQQLEPATDSATGSAYGQLFRSCVRAAHAQGASDIHIEPTKSGVDIRFRVFGEMQPPWKQLALDHKQSFIVAAKKETRLAIGVSGKPQDSRCSVEGVPVDLRVNLLPTLFGEKIVLRLLDAGREFGIKKLGIPTNTLTDMMAALNYRNGVVLISGPTGSGKTTTLYSMLCAIDRTRKNIVTLEDPVEYTIAGINQVRIDPKVSFAGALRAVLRQDPDIVLVGEIRDEETAQLAFKAAATGHLVLSTVHANGAVEVVGRLLGLGIDKDTLRENLRFSAAQRLVGRLCQYCAIKAPMTLCKYANDAVEQPVDASRSTFRIRNMSGCEHCHEGVTGRIPAIEYMNEAGTARLLEAGSCAPARSGVLKQTLRRAAYDLAHVGLVDVREVTSIG
ncbi:MAG: GspE/PulE family protein [Oligoflexales bacterium]